MIIMKRMLLATATLIALALPAGPARADALGDLIQFRTVEHGETCTRHENFGICTLGKSTEFRAVYLTALGIYGRVVPPFGKIGTPAAAERLCAQLKDGELFTANFVEYKGEVLLNCVLRKTAKP
jgi:hypothetical protein